MNSIDEVQKAQHQPVSEVLVLDRVDLWNDSRFREKLIASIEADGYGKKAAKLVAKTFADNDTPDFDAFRKAVGSANERGQINADDTKLLSDIVAHWNKVRSDNSSVYRPQSVNDYKARYWPNNPKLLETNWEYYEDIYQADLFVESNRFISKETPIVSAGSCFAANISRQLQFWDYNYLLEMGVSKEHHSDPRNYATDPAGCGNIYNAVSMRQMVERAFGEWTPEKILVATRLKFVDPFRSIADYDGIDGYLEKWHEHNDALERALKKCEVFILTLGLTEAWLFADSGLATSTSPVLGDPTLIRHKNLSVSDNVVELERIYSLFQEHNPGVKFITTVSPVPLNATFNRHRHVVVANGLSKSVLRVALEEFCAAHPEDVFYFPAYEIVTAATRNPWEIDMRHVSNEAVARVMEQFQRQFLMSQEPLPIIKVAELQEYIPMRRKPILRFVRERIVHPLKRQLGIEGMPFRALWRRRR